MIDLFQATLSERKKMTMTPQKLDRSVEIFQALAHHLRFQICSMLVDEAVSVNAICQFLDAPQHRVSQQLAILRSSGIVSAKKESRQVFYTVHDDMVKRIIAYIQQDVQLKANVADQQPKPSDQQQARSSSLSFEAGRFSEIR